MDQRLDRAQGDTGLFGVVFSIAAVALIGLSVAFPMIEGTLAAVAVGQTGATAIGFLLTLGLILLFSASLGPWFSSR